VVAAFAAVYLIWGSTYLAILYAIRTIPPFLMAGVRFVVAGAMLYAWKRLTGSPRPARAHWRSAAVVGAALLLCGNGAVTWAEQYVPSGITALLVAMVPVWMVLLQWARREAPRPGGAVAVGLVLGLIGIGLLVGPDAIRGAGPVDPFAALVLTGACISWAAGSLDQRRAALPGDSPLLATGMQMLCGGALLLAVGTVAGEWSDLDLGAVSARSAVSLLYLIAVGALIGYSAYVWLLTASTPAKVATYAYVNPVVAVFLGWALAGERLTPRMIAAAAVIVGAVALVTTSDR
jgi:drug/metabolite transporter (DMT)-like permease